MEQAIGFSLVLLLANVDQQIPLVNDRSTLLDKTWNKTIVKELSNSGRALQNLRKVKDLINSQLGDRTERPSNLLVHLKEINSALFQNKLNNTVQLKKISDVSFEIYSFLSAVIEYADFLRQVRNVIEGNAETEEINELEDRKGLQVVPEEKYTEEEQCKIIEVKP